jgi:uncharacterized protein (TIGR02266 family)
VRDPGISAGGFAVKRTENLVDNSTRQAKRAPVTLKIKFKSETLAQFIERYAVDVSPGGIFIRTKEPLAVGTPMKFEFQLRDASPLITGEGTVVWTRENDPARPNAAPGMGVRFDRLGDGSQPILDKILAEKNRAGTGSTATEPQQRLFTDAPTRVTPSPLVGQLIGESKSKLGEMAPPKAGFGDERTDTTPLPRPMPFHSDAEEFPDETFEEATKVRSVEDLIAATAVDRPIERLSKLSPPPPPRATLAHAVPPAPPTPRPSRTVPPPPPGATAAAGATAATTPAPTTPPPEPPPLAPPPAEAKAEAPTTSEAAAPAPELALPPSPTEGEPALPPSPTEGEAALPPSPTEGEAALPAPAPEPAQPAPRRTPPMFPAEAEAAAGDQPAEAAAAAEDPTAEAKAEPATDQPAAEAAAAGAGPTAEAKAEATADQAAAEATPIEAEATGPREPTPTPSAIEAETTRPREPTPASVPTEGEGAFAPETTARVPALPPPPEKKPEPRPATSKRPFGVPPPPPELTDPNRKHGVSAVEQIEQPPGIGTGLIVLAIVFVLALGGLVWFFFIRKAPEEVAPPAPADDTEVSTAPGSAPGGNAAGSNAAGSPAPDVQPDALPPEPPPNAVRTELSSPAPDAMISIPGESFSGPSPLTVDLEKGKQYTIRVIAPGYKQSLVQLIGGQKLAPVKLEPLEHILRISSNPPGAAISIDGDSTGKKTPADVRLTRRQIGQASVKVEVSKRGHTSFSREVPIGDFAVEGDDMVMNLSAQLTEK